MLEIFTLVFAMITTAAAITVIATAIGTAWLNRKIEQDRNRINRMLAVKYREEEILPPAPREFNPWYY